MPCHTWRLAPLLAALLALANFNAAAGAKLPLGWSASDHATEAGAGKPHIRRHPSPTSFVFRLSFAGDDSSTESSSSSSSSAAALKVSQLGAVHGATLELPLCTGGTVELTLTESTILPPEMRGTDPDLLPFNGYGTSSVDGSGVHADITFTTLGIHAQLWTSNGVCYVDPHSAGRTDVYSIYHASDPHPSGANPYPARTRDVGRGVDPFDPLTHDYLASQQSRRSLQSVSSTGGSPGFTLVTPPSGPTWQRVYRIAVLPTYEYAQFAASVGLSTSALMTMSFQRALGVWAREMGFYFQFASTQNNLLNLTLNALPNNNLDPSMKQAAAVAAGLGLLESQYDFGHIVCVGGAGGMGGGQPCSADPNAKWQGATCGTAPLGDSYDVEYLAHEMAHQFGLSHVWSGMRGGCTADQFSPAGALEVGSGSTLVTYAGICGNAYSDPDNGDDVVVAGMSNKINNAAGQLVTKSSSLPYFHILSLSQFENAFWYGGQMSGKLEQPCDDLDTYCNNSAGTTYYANVRGYGNSSSSNTCGIWTVSTNTRPSATAPTTCNIPKATPFVLAGTAVDKNGDVLAYNWEQVDPSPKRVALGVENREGPLYVSAVPSANGNVRFMPQWSTLMGPWQNVTNFVDPLERLSSVNRSLHFAMTVRDHFYSNGTTPMNATWNSTGGLGAAVPIIGSWHSALTTVVVADLGPLNIISPNVSFGTYDAKGAPSLQLNVVIKLSGLADYNKKVKEGGANPPPPLSQESSAIANTNWTVYIQNLTAACQQNDPSCPWRPTGVVLNVSTSSAGTANALVTFTANGTYNIIVTDPAIATNAGFATTAVCGGFTLVTVTVINVNPASSNAPTVVRAAHVPRYTAVGNWAANSIVANTSVSSGLVVPVSTFSFTVPPLAGTAPLNTTNTVSLWDIEDNSTEACIFNLAAPDFTGPDANGLITADFMSAGCFLYPGSNYNWVFGANTLPDTQSSNSAQTIPFSTANDTVPPVVTTTNPLPSSTGQQEDDAITFYFSEWVDLNPNGTITFTPVNPANGQPLVITVPACYPFDCDLPDNIIVASDDYYIQVYPTETLASSSNYTVTIGSGTVSDIAGLNLTAYSLPFQTGDSYAPIMTSASTFANLSMVGWCFTFNEPILPSRGNIYFQSGNFSNVVRNAGWNSDPDGTQGPLSLVNPNTTSRLNFLLQRTVTDSTCSFVYNKTSLCGYVRILAANAQPDGLSLPSSVTSTPVGLFVAPNVVKDLGGNQIAVPNATKVPQDILDLTKSAALVSAGNLYSAAIAPVVLAGVTQPPSPPSPSPVPYATVTVSMTLAGVSVASFNNVTIRTVFINTVAATVNVSAGSVIINNVTASKSRRHLHAVGDAVVSYSVNVASAAALASVTTSLNNLTTSAGAASFKTLLNSNLVTAGVTGVSVSSIAATPPPATTTTTSSGSSFRLPRLRMTSWLVLAALLASAL